MSTHDRKKGHPIPGEREEIEAAVDDIGPEDRPAVVAHVAASPRARRTHAPVGHRAPRTDAVHPMPAGPARTVDARARPAGRATPSDASAVRGSRFGLLTACAEAAREIVDGIRCAVDDVREGLRRARHCFPHG